MVDSHLFIVMLMVKYYSSTVLNATLTRLECCQKGKRLSSKLDKIVFLSLISKPILFPISIIYLPDKNQTRSTSKRSINLVSSASKNQDSTMIIDSYSHTIPILLPKTPNLLHSMNLKIMSGLTNTSLKRQTVIQ